MRKTEKMFVFQLVIAPWSMGNVFFDFEGDLLKYETSYEALVYRNLGVTKFRGGDVDGAVDAYIKALTIDPKYAEIWYNLGLVKKAQGDLDRAEKAFQKAKQLKPSLFN